MNTPRFAKLIARWLSALEVTRAPDPTALPRSIATVERALALRRRRGRRNRLWWAAAAAACLGAGAIAAVQLWGAEAEMAAPRLFAKPLGRGAWLTAAEGGGNAGGVELGTGIALDVGARLSTAEGGGAELVFATGTRVYVAEGSSLDVLSQDAQVRLALHTGRLGAHVEKLVLGERFVVELPGAEVEVKGTRFELSVRRDCALGPRAEVRVEEGVVEVRSAARVLRLSAGQQWSAECESESPKAELQRLPSAPSAPSAGGARAPAPVQRLAVKRKGHGGAPGAEDRSSLTEENELFSAAVAASRRGEVDLALALYSELAARFPASALKENALLARVRLLAGRDPKHARAEARRFLARYPDSVARAELEPLLEQE